MICRAVATISCVITLLLAGCRPSESAGARADAAPPNILIVVLDACRADKLGCYGFDRETSPAIDALSRDPDAVTFRRHHVQGAFTKASTASLFTGLYAFQHGVSMGNKMQAGGDEGRTVPVQILDARFKTMAERFREMGYATLGLVTMYHLDPRYGFAQGFDTYVPPSVIPDDPQRRHALVRTISGASRPFFGYLHQYACHHPFPAVLRHSEYLGQHGFPYDERARQADGIDFTTSAIQDAINDGEVSLEADDARFLNLIYEAKLRTVDEFDVQPLLEALKVMGWYDDTLLILTADHGEELYDHGGYGHGHAMWEEVIRVPLIVKFPKGRKPASLPRSVETVTQAIDLLPALLAYVGADPDAALPGADIFGGPGRDVVYCETADSWTLTRGDHKLIWGARSGLFDLAADPLETNDLSAAEPEQVEALRAAAAAMRRNVAIAGFDAPVIEDELDEQALKALRSLGYVR
jgi:arylsulfatase A-like enzyme